MEIVPNVHQIDGVNANVYLIINSKGITMIDTGLPGQIDKIKNYIDKIGIKYEEINKIILTHCHIDHMGNVYELKQLTKAILYVHEKDAKYVSGKEKIPYPEALYNMLAQQMSQQNLTLNFVEPDCILKEGDIIEDYAVIHNPGHTPGSISLYNKEKKILFVGDEFRYINGVMQGPPEQFTPDMNQAIESMKKLVSLDFEIMLSGHGEPLTKNAAEKIQNYYATLIK
jgi:glyoxylase-like metal-dependent hydrolase (beta-lactamase superfamily II)